MSHQSGSPGREQLRRAIKGLETAGLIEIKSTRENLILKCLLADPDNSVQNKPDIIPTSQTAIVKQARKPVTTRAFQDIQQKADRGKKAKADIPHNSDQNFIFLCDKSRPAVLSGDPSPAFAGAGLQAPRDDGAIIAKFQQFWASYPHQMHEATARQAFHALNPDEGLFSQIMTALENQKQHYQQLQTAGQWVPAWRYPANWLRNHGWNDALAPLPTQEKTHENHERTHAKKSAFDMFWKSCKGGTEFSFGDDEYGI